MFRPKIFDTLKHYNQQQFGKDLMAGVIVGLVALPLAIAFAIASGVSPEKGLYAAIVAGFLISARAAAGFRSEDPPAPSLSLSTVLSRYTVSMV